MEKKDYKKAIDDIVDRDIPGELPTDKLWALLGEMTALSENYIRELAILQISSNHSNRKHLCQTILHGKLDDEILVIMASITASLRDELERRKSNKV